MIKPNIKVEKMSLLLAWIHRKMESIHIQGKTTFAF